MSATITIDTGDGRYVQGSRYIRKGSGNLGTSYTTGGLALTAAQFEFPGTIAELDVAPAAGFFFEWDKTNSKLIAKAAVRVYTATYDAASLANVTSVDDAITFTGVAATDVSLAVIPPPAAAASVVVQAHHVSGANTVTARLTNASAGAVDLASGTWTAIVCSANGAAYEIAATTDLSAATFRFRAEGY